MSKPPDRSRCSTCPVAAVRPCGGLDPDRAIFCDWSPNPATHAHIVKVSAMLASGHISSAAPDVSAAPSPVKRLTPAVIDRINTCLYRECRTGCQRSVCHAGKGDYWNQVTLEDCRRCLLNLPPVGG